MSNSAGGNKNLPLLIGMGIYALMMLWQAYVAITCTGVDALPIGIAIIQLAVVLPMWMMKDSAGDLRSYAQWLIVGTIGVGFMISTGYSYDDYKDIEAKEKDSILVDLGYFEQQELEEDFDRKIAALASEIKKKDGQDTLEEEYRKQAVELLKEKREKLRALETERDKEALAAVQAKIDEIGTPNARKVTTLLNQEENESAKLEDDKDAEELANERENLISQLTGGKGGKTHKGYTDENNIEALRKTPLRYGAAIAGLLLVLGGIRQES